MKKEVKYRLDINYLSKNYSDRALETSSPIYTKKEGLQKYFKKIKEKCIDNQNIPVRVHFWKYAGWDKNNQAIIETICKNY